MSVLQCEGIVHSVCPGVLEVMCVCYLCHRHVLVSCSCVCQIAVEAVVVCERPELCQVCLEREARDNLPCEAGLVGEAVRVLEVVVLVDVVNRRGELPVTLDIEVFPLLVARCVLTDTVCRPVVQYADESLCAYAACASAEVTAVCEAWVDEEAEVRCELRVNLGVHVCAAHS